MRKHRRLSISGLGGIVVILLALILVGGMGIPQVRAQVDDDDDTVEMADDMEFNRHVTVSGTGTADATPDRAVVIIGVQTDAETAGTALSDNSEAMEAVIDALVDAGIDEDDIQTEVVRLNPRYEEPPRTPVQDDGEQELVGFTATNLVRVTMQDLDMLGEVLDAAVTAGGNRIEGIRFEISDESALLSDAREAAWDDAEQKAQQLADLAGAELGPVLTIDATVGEPQPLGIGGRGFAVEEAAAAVPIQPGTQTVQVSLQVTWALVSPE